MLKYVGYYVVFREIPDEISLAINITNCPIRCVDCHSKKLWEDIGNELNWDELQGLISENPGITCVLFMGGDANLYEVEELAKLIRQNYNLKIALYSGNRMNVIRKVLHFRYFDYIKTGPFIKERGPLNSKNTNQRLYKVVRNFLDWKYLKDITKTVK